MLYKETGQRIRHLRETNNYTRDAFAEKVDISTKFLYEIGSGKKGFSAGTLFRISKALSVSCDYLLTGNAEDNKAVEKVICMLECFEPKQMGSLRDILKLIYDMCVKP